MEIPVLGRWSRRIVGGARPGRKGRDSLGEAMGDAAGEPLGSSIMREDDDGQ